MALKKTQPIIFTLLISLCLGHAKLSSHLMDHPFLRWHGLTLTSIGLMAAGATVCYRDFKKFCKEEEKKGIKATLKMYKHFLVEEGKGGKELLGMLMTSGSIYFLPFLLFPLESLLNQIGKENRDTNTQLFISYIKGDRAIGALQHFFHLGIDINSKGLSGDSLLHTAALHKHENAVACLILLKGLPINVQNDQGETPLHYAVRRHYSGCGDKKKEAVEKEVKAILSYLIKCGADATIRDNRGKTPLIFAIDQRNMSALEAFKKMKQENSAYNIDLAAACAYAKNKLKEIRMSHPADPATGKIYSDRVTIFFEEVIALLEKPS